MTVNSKPLVETKDACGWLWRLLKEGGTQAGIGAEAASINDGNASTLP